MAKNKKEEITIRSSAAEYLTYIASVGDTENSVEMRYEDENIWLTQKMMAVLYNVEIPTINYHINKIFKDSELQKDSVIRKFLITAANGFFRMRLLSYFIPCNTAPVPQTVLRKCRRSAQINYCLPIIYCNFVILKAKTVVIL